MPGCWEAFPSFPGVPGRMERVRLAENTRLANGRSVAVPVAVDYQPHTPDGLEKRLAALQTLFLPAGRTDLCLFGCGEVTGIGAKRPQIGGQLAASAWPDRVVRHLRPKKTHAPEDPGRILGTTWRPAFPGRHGSAGGKGDRAKSPAIALSIAAGKTARLIWVLIAGKGHED